jgi:hypothetical protein
MLYDKRWDAPLPTTKLDDWQQLLLDAANILEMRGWVRRHFRSPDGFCAVGSMREAAGFYLPPFDVNPFTIPDVNPFPDTPRAESYRIALSRLEHALGMPTVKWNDRRARSKNEVVAKLRKVAYAV